MEEKNDAKGLIGALGKFMRGIKDYNILELVKVLFAVFCIVIAITFVMRPELYVDKISYILQTRQNRQDMEHASLLNRRKIADQNIRWYLNELRDMAGADRAWLLEPHNGGSNSTTGLSFYYLNMTGDEPADGYPDLNKSQFTNIQISEYPLANIIDKKGRWYGNLESMYDVDKKLYYRMKAQGMNECAVMAVHSKNLPVCFVGLTWYEGHKMNNPEEVGDVIRKYSMQIALELMKVE